MSSIYYNKLGANKMKKFTFIEGITKHKKGVTEEYKDINEEIEERGFKKAVKSIQNKQKDFFVSMVLTCNAFLSKRLPMASCRPSSEKAIQKIIRTISM